MNDDAELLLRYSREGEQAAFAELVQRHLPLVYQTALRQLGGNTHLAQEAAQNVFIAMGHKAAELAQRPTLTGWLYISACFAAKKLIRSAQRRQHWEQESIDMQTVHEPEWSQIRPELDALLLRLGEADREALLLRYCEGLRFGDIARKLRLTEDGARLRVDRAIEKLRQLLARRGITSTSAALATVLTAHAAATAPVGLATTISAGALASLASGTTTSATIVGSLKLILMSKLTLTAVTAAVLVTAASIYFVRRAQSSPVETTLAPSSVTITPSPAPKPALQQRIEALRATKAKAFKGETETIIGESGTPDPKAAARRDQVLADLDHGFFRIESLVHVGADTPRAAVTSFRWALEHASFNDIAQMIQLSPEDKKSAEAILATLPPSARNEYPDAEHLLALYAARDASVVYPTQGVVQITSEQVDAKDGETAKAHVTLQYDQGIRDQLDQKNHEDFDLQQTSTGWKIIVPPSATKQVMKWITEPEAAAQKPTP
jgi:RNA polymerase sigma factor (sigma-70 family)